jgi:2-polyprenyl-3-methyl-5-hydroxy-6-metoxy-1,4-benzoquinol methylase
MKDFNEHNIFNSNELDYLTGKYKEKNPISRFLVEHFYLAIEKITGLLEPTDRVIEVGCGAGISSLRIYRSLRGQSFEVSDIDSNAMLQFEKLGFPIPFQQESATDLKRNDNEFDCVFLLEVLEHIPDYKKTLSELSRVSKKYIVISTPNEPIWRILNILRGKYLASLGNTPGHINHWSSSALIRLISEYGDIVKVYTPLPWTIVVARVRTN